MHKVRYITKDYLARFLPENPIIIEAGGHIGRDAIEMAKTWPHGHLYTFEPVPPLFAQLQANVAPYQNISAYNVALSDTTGTAIMQISSSACDAVSSLLKPQQFLEQRPDVLFTATPVATTRLDDWAAAHSVDRIDLFWLDVQGYELAALHGAEKLLATAQALHLEVSLAERYAGNPLYHEVVAWLETKGFLVHTEAIYRKTWGNVLFVRKNIHFPMSLSSPNF